ncbi:hypothetical protein MELA_02699, partial [Candidatus Methylomirabilis lanthanidiphila]
MLPYWEQAAECDGRPNYDYAGLYNTSAENAHDMRNCAEVSRTCQRSFNK